jgi:hypothetical protein
MHLFAFVLAAAVPLASGISQDRVEEVVADRSAALRGCYEEGLARNKDLRGTIAVTMKVSEAGRVAEAKSAPGTTLPDADVVTCVVDVMKTLEFGTQEAPQTVRYAMAFAPDPPPEAGE